MTDQKGTDLAEVTALANSDLLVSIQNPGSSPVSKKIQTSNALRLAYGGITVTTPGTQNLTGGGAWDPVTQYDTNTGLALNVTEDHTNDQVIAGVVGVYEVTGYVRFSGDATTAYSLAIFYDGSLAFPLGTYTTDGAGDYVGHVPIVGDLVNVTVASTAFDLRASHAPAATPAFVLEDSVLKILRVA